ncbi:complement C1q tumor necrosis factor-related protein 3-like [Parambassis ranga]|uniref:Complement C1q tumor necrosis factor-related protein 3-like n=1 Tax=Parambassis ranga TaxID=210632 RepID=A0A6P7IFH3_9TELE|nr:complement C1q tumor necrosis factor-related protein 3-like [Parambassis ranga]XP_028261663.1 complement C1q tumor necrosis factor-related protein 3-like [Parambassis ranga]
MKFRTLLLLTLLGFLAVELGFGQRGDTDINQWMSAKDTLIKSLEEKVNKVEKCQEDLAGLDSRLKATEDKLTRQKAETDKLKEENEGLKTRLDAVEKELNRLGQSVGRAAPQIAFSASLANTGEIYRGPCTDKALIFKRVFSNAGNGYDSNTGIFTAPVNGLYHFTFSTYGYNTHTVGAILKKNNVHQISTYDSPSSDSSDFSSNAAVLQLAAGDRVHLELWDNGRVYDNLNGHTTFSGFLLFTLKK